MRDSIKEYEAVEAAALKFVKSVAEGDSRPARELFTDDAVLFGFLDGKLERPVPSSSFTVMSTRSAAVPDSKPVSMWSPSRRRWPWSVSSKRGGAAASTSQTTCCC